MNPLERYNFKSAFTEYYCFKYVKQKLKELKRQRDESIIIIHSLNNWWKRREKSIMIQQIRNSISDFCLFDTNRRLYRTAAAYIYICCVSSTQGILMKTDHIHVEQKKRSHWILINLFSSYNEIRLKWIIKILNSVTNFLNNQ